MLFSTARLRQSAQHNLQVFKTRPLAEVSGSLGSLCLFLPPFATAVANRSIHLSSSLIWTGLANVLLGVFYGLPMPVQPMILNLKWWYHLETTMELSLGVAIYLVLLTATGFMRWLNLVMPVPIVKGVQVSTGLLVILNAGEQLLRPLPWDLSRWGTTTTDNMYWALAAYLFLFACNRARRLPYALIVVTLGLVLAIGNDPLYAPFSDQPPLSGIFPFIVPSWVRLDHILFDDALNEFPRTILTSIIAHRTSHKT